MLLYLIISPWQRVEALAADWSAARSLPRREPRQKPPHVAPLAKPRATRETPGPSSRLPPLPSSRGRFCVDAACGDGESERELGQWVSDSVR